MASKEIREGRHQEAIGAADVDKSPRALPPDSGLRSTPLSSSPDPERVDSRERERRSNCGAGSPSVGLRSTRSAEALNDELDEQYEDDGIELDCTHCGGEGTCDDNANPLWDCDDNPHPCHACGGSGNRRDQRIF